ncbi:MAG: exodeoxyribonuclease VII small subunit [Prevotellaceae bacterium]|jgi:exodeoxyribonuclease VII small subunit|nr:exodeoxyribonuclease VII small subunit [Prevotellaceae bacterium]
MEEMNYEQAISEIERVIRDMESGNQEIEEIISNVKHVAELIKFCKNKLHGVENELNLIFNDN